MAEFADGAFQNPGDMRDSSWLNLRTVRFRTQVT